jgi:16S rRNA (guanine1516-N2)-methyltransferase
MTMMAEVPGATAGNPVAAAAAVVVAADSLNRGAGLELAERLGLAFLDVRAGAAGVAPFLLSLGPDGLALHCAEGGFGPISCDFAGGRLWHRHHFGGGLGQGIARAVGLKQSADLWVADLTAGLGEDAFVLAGLGARVVLLERHPVIGALLEDGLRRARQLAGNSSTAATIERMDLILCDAFAWLQARTGDNCPDVAYLDPMFPERTKSARVRKEMQALQRIVGADGDSAALLELALDRARYRVVVKRPRHAPPLGTRSPSFAVTGRSTRYDVYALRRLPGRG